MTPPTPAPEALLDPANDPTDIPSLQTLITSLRDSLSTSQTLLASHQARLLSLSEVESQLNDTKDSHAFISAAKEAVEKQLKEEIKRREVAEETVESLRGQVEAARRGVMTLQKQEKERKRMSMVNLTPGVVVGGGMGLGLGGLGEEEILHDASGSASGGGNLGVGLGKPSKRQSMIKTHRRISSQSEPDGLYATATTPTTTTTTTTSASTSTSPNPSGPPNAAGQPVKPGLREFKLGSATGTGTTSHTSTFTSPQPMDEAHDVSPKNDPSVLSVASASSNPINTSEDLTRLQRENDRLKLELSESEEARLASETCLRALREFIALSPGGGGVDPNDPDAKRMDLGEADLMGIRLPPLPTDRDPHDEGPVSPPVEEKKGAGGGWGFKLWKGQGQGQGQLPGGGPMSPRSPGEQQYLSPPAGSNKSLPPSVRTSPLPTPNDHPAATGRNCRRNIHRHCHAISELRTKLDERCRISYEHTDDSDRA